MVKVFTFSEAGGHPVNEDAFAVRPHPDDDRCLLVALADGQGGQPNGGPAARLACRSAIDGVAGNPVKSLVRENYWPSLLRLADQAVCHEDGAGLTTLIGLAVHSNRLAGASSGDSAVMVFDRSDRVRDLTRGQMKNPPVGSGEAFFVPFAADLVAPWLVLAMSDGVWKYVGWDRLKDMASCLRGQALIDSLQQSARLRGSGKFQDDFTLVLIQDSD